MTPLELTYWAGAIAASSVALAVTITAAIFGALMLAWLVDPEGVEEYRRGN